MPHNQAYLQTEKKIEEALKISELKHYIAFCFFIFLFSLKGDNYGA